MNESSLPPSVEQPPRKSITPANPYNESLIKTFESSEFEQGLPVMLPGTIFGQGPPQLESQKSSESPMKNLMSPHISEQSIQVNNLDQNLSKFYALAQESQITTTENTEQRRLVEGSRITHERDSMALNSVNDDFNPYDQRASNPLMHHTLKVEKMK